MEKIKAISKKAHFFVLLVMLCLSFPFYKDLISELYTFNNSPIFNENHVPADFVFNKARGGKGQTDFYEMRIYLKEALGKNNKSITLALTDYQVGLVKTLYLENTKNKIFVDVNYKINKYWPSNFFDYIIPLEVKTSNKVILSKEQANILFFKGYRVCVLFFLVEFSMVYFGIIFAIRSISSM